MAASYTWDATHIQASNILKAGVYERVEELVILLKGSFNQNSWNRSPYDLFKALVVLIPNCNLLEFI